MPQMRSDLRTGVGTFSSLTGLRDAIAPDGTRPPQWMRAVLLISMGSLSSHHFASSINGSLAPSFNSTPFGDIMGVVWVQENARWDGFSSSHLGQLNCPKRNTLETAFSFFKFPLKFSDQRRKSKRHVLGKNRGRTAAGPPWAGRTEPADLPQFAGRYGPVFHAPPLFCIFSP
jgi:hypothetical protein